MRELRQLSNAEMAQAGGGHPVPNFIVDPISLSIWLWIHASVHFFRGDVGTPYGHSGGSVRGRGNVNVDVF